MAFTPNNLLDNLEPRLTSGRLVVAYSGGMDSHVLLHALCAIRQSIQSSIIAVYIDHGLQAASAGWVDHCRRVCESLSVPFESRSLKLNIESGESIEAMARTARYAALQEIIGEEDLLLTAHHQDDQAETLLLQLLRGAGPAGLASMPISKPFGNGWHVRPLLNTSREALEGYAKSNGLHWIEDLTNQSLDFDRNYLRNQVIPLIKQRWPSMDATLSRSAHHCAEAVELLEQDVANRLNRLQADEANTLPVDELRGMTDSQLKHVIRGWVSQMGFPALNHHKLEVVRSQLINAGADRMPLIKWKGGELRRYRDKLYLSRPLVPFDASFCTTWNTATPMELPFGLGTISLVPATGGLSEKVLKSGRCEIRFRQGGERMRPLNRGGSVSLKQLFQELAIPPWMRDRIPLLYIDNELAAVGGDCFSEHFMAQKDEVSLKTLIK